MQPRVIDPRSVARRVDLAMGGGTAYDSENEKSIEDCKLYGGSYAKSTGCRREIYNCNTYDSSIDTFEQMYNGDSDHNEDQDEEETESSEVPI